MDTDSSLWPATRPLLQPVPRTGVLPGPSPPGGVPGTAPELRGKVAPPATGAQHEQDAFQRGTIIDPRTPTRTSRSRPSREQRPNQLPEPVVNESPLPGCHDRRGPRAPSRAPPWSSPCGLSSTGRSTPRYSPSCLGLASTGGLVLSLNASAIYLGTAIGGLVGGIVIGAGDLLVLPVVSAGFSLVVIPCYSDASAQPQARGGGERSRLKRLPCRVRRASVPAQDRVDACTGAISIIRRRARRLVGSHSQTVRGRRHAFPRTGPSADRRAYGRKPARCTVRQRNPCWSDRPRPQLAQRGERPRQVATGPADRCLPVAPVTSADRFKAGPPLASWSLAHFATVSRSSGVPKPHLEGTKRS
jgi:hypothetical protein